MRQILNPIFRGKKYLLRLILPVVMGVMASWLVAAPAGATGIYQMPSLSQVQQTWVIDQAEILSRITEGKISNQLKKIAEETGNQVRIVTIHRLDYGETAQSFADKLFEKWFPTPEAQANQALVVLDNVTNNAGIRTGDEVKSILTDDIAQSTISETLQVPLREGNKYNEALVDVSDRLVAVLSGQPDPGPPVVEQHIQVEGTFKSAEETNTTNATVIVVVLLVIATVVPMVTYFWYQGGFQ